MSIIDDALRDMRRMAAFHRAALEAAQVSCDCKKADCHLGRIRALAAQVCAAYGAAAAEYEAEKAAKAASPKEVPIADVLDALAKLAGKPPVSP